MIEHKFRAAVGDLFEFFSLVNTASIAKVKFILLDTRQLAVSIDGLERLRHLGVFVDTEGYARSKPFEFFEQRYYDSRFSTTVTVDMQEMFPSCDWKTTTVKKVQKAAPIKVEIATFYVAEGKVRDGCLERFQK